MRRALLILGTTCVLAACSSGHGVAKGITPPTSNGASRRLGGASYQSANALVVKLRAAGLRCTLSKAGGFSVDGMPKPKDQTMCDLKDADGAEVVTAIFVYDDGAVLQRALDVSHQVACGFGAKKMPYDVTGSNWWIGTAYYRALALEVAVAAGGNVSQQKSC